MTSPIPYCHEKTRQRVIQTRSEHFVRFKRVIHELREQTDMLIAILGQWRSNGLGRMDKVQGPEFQAK